MATSAQLLKAQEAGAEIRITTAGQPEGGIVEYSPRHKGDRKPWVYQSGRYVTEGRRYSAKDVAATTPTPVVEETPEVTQETIEALRTLRANVNGYGMDTATAQAVVILDNAGVFAHIDAATDAKEAPKNIAARAKEARRESIQRAVGLKF